MADHMHWAALLLSTFVAFICDCKPIDGYKFPVYTTESCPRNQTEWMERSSAINCTESNGYLCLPSEDLTELLEFCYFEYQIPIAKGLCMFLRKRDSYIDGYNCSNFDEGCPNSTYRMYEAYKYRSCVSIGNMCFLAESTCHRTTETYFLSTIPDMTTSIGETNSTMQDIIQFKERNDWVWILTLLGAGALICVPVIVFCLKLKSKDKKENRMKKYRKPDNENTTGNPSSTKIFRTVDSNNGDESTLHLLLKNDANVNLFEKNRTKSLYMACQGGHYNIVEVLIKKGGDVNLCTSKGFSPLATASEKGHERIVQLLIENGANVNLFENNGASPLYMACQGGHNNIVEVLIQKGGDVNLCNSKGFSPLAATSRNGHESTVQLLLENGANVN